MVKRFRKILIGGGIFFAFIFIFLVVSLYYIAYKSNTGFQDKYVLVKIPTGNSYQSVKKILQEKQLIGNVKSFDFLARIKNYPRYVKPGNYKIIKEWGNNKIINRLLSGQQEPVDVTFNNIRTKAKLAGVIANQLELDSLALDSILRDTSYLKRYSLAPGEVLAMFIPNTYEFFWNTTANGFFERMLEEYHRFWGQEREARLPSTGLNKMEVSILASIVDEETRRNDEMPTIAGVYINRLERGIPLQADPTIKFAHGDFEIKRVLTRHLDIDSPYNTYKYRGVPPGPIRVPSIAAIDAVLHFEEHNYLYFCAKADFSGYHEFSTNLREHLQNARKYQRALNRKRIWR